MLFVIIVIAITICYLADLIVGTMERIAIKELEVNANLNKDEVE